MSEGAPAAAPTAAPAANAPANTNTEAKGASKAPGQVAEAKAPPAWSDTDDAELFERLKRSPYKAKIKGQERGLDSKQSLQEILGHAQRGIGATKMVEETKLEREAAAKERAEAAAERELIKRAKAGDWQAKKELGLLDPAELRARNDEWEAMPPEVRELYEDRQRLAQEKAELQQKWESKEREENDRREATALGQAKRMAMTETHRVLHAIGMTEQNQERLMPFVAGAIADLREHGLELGVDMPPELIVQRFKELVGDFEGEMFGGLQAEKAAALFEKRLETMDDGALLKTLSPKMANRIAKAVARAQTARRAQTASGGSITRASNDNEEREKPPGVLPFHRWQR
jgi:hypothetical protein